MVAWTQLLLLPSGLSWLTFHFSLTDVGPGVQLDQRRAGVERVGKVGVVGLVVVGVVDADAGDAGQRLRVDVDGMSGGTGEAGGHRHGQRACGDETREEP